MSSQGIPLVRTLSLPIVFFECGMCVFIYRYKRPCLFINFLDKIITYGIMKYKNNPPKGKIGTIFAIHIVWKRLIGIKLVLAFPG
jgi:hypothetical protein